MRQLIRLSLFSIVLMLVLTSCGSGVENSTSGEKGDKGEKGDTGSSGAGISSNKKIDASVTDRCDTDDLVCYFTGGQRILFSDGTVIITGEWSFLDQSAGNDSDLNSIAMVVPSTATTTYKVIAQLVRLPAGVGGTGNTRKMFLVYTVSSDTVTLVWDKNNNGTLDETSSTDVIVQTLTLSSW